MKGIVCFDLTNGMDNNKIREISVLYDLDYNEIVSLKEKKAERIYVLRGVIVAYLIKDDSGNSKMMIGDDYGWYLQNEIKPYVSDFKKECKDLDSILDKINKYGMAYLTENEKRILENY